jgi:hypothetical protein
MESIRFDDVEKLRSKVSQEFSAWSKPIDAGQLTARAFINYEFAEKHYSAFLREVGAHHRWQHSLSRGDRRGSGESA